MTLQLLPESLASTDPEIAGSDISVAESLILAVSELDAAQWDTRPGSPWTAECSDDGRVRERSRAWDARESPVDTRLHEMAEAGGALGAAMALLAARAYDLPYDSPLAVGQDRMRRARGVYVRVLPPPTQTGAGLGSGYSVYGGGALERRDEESRPRTDPSGRPFSTWWRD